MSGTSKPPTAILFDIGGVVVRTSSPQTLETQANANTAGHKPLPSHPRLRNREQDPRRIHQLRDPERTTRYRRMAAN
jgi:hypothetical protein